MNLKYLGILIGSVFIVACGGGGPEQVRRNAPPAIGAVADQSVTANQASAPIGFTISDERVAAVTVEVTSDNQSVIPDSGLQVAGNGASRSVSITPALDQLGDAFITITATDSDGASSSQSFLIVIDPQPASMQQFTRDEFAGSADDAPALVNALSFAQDADQDDFADLLSQ